MNEQVISEGGRDGNWVGNIFPQLQHLPTVQKSGGSDNKCPWWPE